MCLCCAGRDDPVAAALRGLLRAAAVPGAAGDAAARAGGGVAARAAGADERDARVQERAAAAQGGHVAPGEHADQLGRLAYALALALHAIYFVQCT